MKRQSSLALPSELKSMVIVRKMAGETDVLVIKTKPVYQKKKKKKHHRAEKTIRIWSKIRKKNAMWQTLC